MNALSTSAGQGIMERVLAAGDLKNLTPAERNQYYGVVCQSVGLNPLTRPFEYITLNGKLVLYARRDCADQLRKLNGVSLRVTKQETVGDLFVVTIEAQDKDGRTDTDIGAVAISSLRGEALANAMLKACTKAKRRVTLSICGLGFLDETEVADIPRGERQEWRESAPAAPVLDHDPLTGEVVEAGELPRVESTPAKPANGNGSGNGHKTKTINVYNDQDAEIGQFASLGEYLDGFAKWWTASRTTMTSHMNADVLRQIVRRMPDDHERRGEVEKLLADLEEDLAARDQGGLDV